MSRVVPLPPIVKNQSFKRKFNTGLEMSVVPMENIEMEGVRHRHRSSTNILSSRRGAPELTVDFILVYDREQDEENETTIDGQQKRNVKASERRHRFESYLRKRQGLILEHVTSESGRIGFVKIHTPFDTLLITAENMRMRLPIEKIDNDDENVSALPKIQTKWQSFIKLLKKPFLLDPSLGHNDPDYYTAIYSSSIKKFDELFDTLRGSKDLYFTASERSLLTYELLSRAQFDYDDDDDDDDDDNNIVNHGNEPDANDDDRKRKTKNKKVLKRHGIDRLIAKKAYKSYFPLHESLGDSVTNTDDCQLNDREKLKKHWATFRQCMKFQPLSLIRSYMGEKVAFYFALCGFYNKLLIFPAIFGLIIFIYGISSVFSDQPTSDICGSFGQNITMCPRCDDTCEFWKLSDSCIYSKISYVFDNTATVVFAIVMSLWARLFVEFWKRRQSALQYDWDSMDFEEHFEPIRPDFEAKSVKIGEQRINPVTGIKEPFIPTQKRVPFFVIAAAVVLFTMAIVCATLFGTIAYRVRMDYLLKKTLAKSYSPIIITVTSAIMNLICSIILSKFYYWIARKITNIELHKYQSTYDDSLTIKIYLFQFVNFYSSLFYVAFFKGRFFEYPSKYGEANSGDYTEQCDPAGCLVELSVQLVIIMVGKQITNNVIEFFTAMSRTFLGRCCCCCTRDKTDEPSQWEKDNELFEFESDTLIDEYLELVIQFGFVTLFVVAFPLAPLFALVNNIIELRLDAWKFLSKYRRPIPHKASDIGIWSDIMSGISYFAVLTNAIIIAWTSEFIPKMCYRSLESNSANLQGYINWTLSSFPIADYNRTGTLQSAIPTNITYCRYRDFRESTGPSYLQTTTYWNVTAARLAFIIVFEHIIFLIIYLIQWLVSDIPRDIQNKIKHERYIDQRERWLSKATEDHLKTAVISSEVLSKMLQTSSNDAVSGSSHKESQQSLRENTKKRREFTVKVPSTDQ